MGSLCFMPPQSEEQCVVSLGRGPAKQTHAFQGSSSVLPHMALRAGRPVDTGVPGCRARVPLLQRGAGVLVVPSARSSDW